MMARGVNRVTLIGNLGNDPEVNQTNNGTAVANVSLAVNESWKDKSGQKQERTEWVSLIFWSKLAEIAGEYLRKGSQVYVEGKLQTREWEKDGVKRYSTEVVVSDMQMLGGKPEGSRPAQQPAQQAPGYDDFQDSEIPF